MRYNGGGNTFVNPPLIEGIIRSDKLQTPGRLFVIIGRGTFSAAQNTTSELERRTQAILVGEPTGSNPNFIGESIRIPFPYSGWAASLSDLWWQHSMAMDYRVWTHPELYAPPTGSTLRAHRDPAMEAIAAYRAHAAERAGIWSRGRSGGQDEIVGGVRHIFTRWTRRPQGANCSARSGLVEPPFAAFYLQHALELLLDVALLDPGFELIEIDEMWGIQIVRQPIGCGNQLFESFAPRLRATKVSEVCVQRG